MALTPWCSSCGDDLPRGGSACPQCGRRRRYQSRDDTAANAKHVALEQRRQPAFAAAARESAAAQTRFNLAENASERASAGAGQGRATFVPDHPPVQESDAEQALLVALSQGDKSAFWPLWQMHSSRLYGICLREMNRNREDAEEALAQSMMKALDSLPIFAPKIVNAKAWLIRLTYNLCKDIYRGRARRQRTAARLEEMADVGRLRRGRGAAAVADDDPSHCQSEHDPQSTIDRLPVRLREPFALRFVEQMSYRDIATRLTLTEVNVRKRIQQARAVLRAQRDNGASAYETPWANSLPRQAAAYSAAAADARHGQQGFEIPAHAGFSRTVCVRLPSGVERHFEIFLDKKPSREHQKIRTLRKYVEHHASGWKNRLKLADLLYEAGAWVEAIEGYRQVLKKQRWLTAVSVRLGGILCLIAGEEAALEVYELALPLAQQRASRRHLRGLIASCRGDLSVAVASFEEATLLEPDNAAHWRALAKALQRSGSSGKPLPHP